MSFIMALFTWLTYMNHNPSKFTLKMVCNLPQSQAKAGDPMKRTPKLFRIAQTLSRIAHEYGIAVVVTNQGQTGGIYH